MTDVMISGAAIHPFGRHADLDPVDMAARTAESALADAGVNWDDITFAVGGTAAAGLASNVGERLGPNGSMFLNVYNGCATGGSALVAASMALRSGDHDAVLRDVGAARGSIAVVVVVLGAEQAQVGIVVGTLVISTVGLVVGIGVVA